ncbi:MAG: hypothetical protein CMJ64_10770 [Planctomycetaceae bacterium]|nr:hypothetical protein [Planctomycetaceae bacterium]
MKTYTLIAALCCLLLPAMQRQASAQSSDQVYVLKGSPSNGIVDAEQTSSSEVVIDVQGTIRRIPVTDIRRVTFVDEPIEMRRARDSILTGQIEQGYAELRKIDANSLKRPIVKADLQYYLAYCQGKLALSGGGDKAAAVRAMVAFDRANASSFHHFVAAELIGDLAVALGSYENATRYYGDIAKSGPSADYKMRGAVLLARALLSQDKFAEAQTQFDAVINSSVDTPAARQQKLVAQAGKAVCLAGLDTPDEGIKLIEELILNNSPDDDKELFGRAYNALGTCYLKAGKQDEALMAFLHVDVLFYANADVHAEALYHLSKLWAAIKKPDRANDARSLLNDRYAGSSWSKKR